jgi:LDH2 family malate/lactate/ureidoglycolate dehydrogenase
MKPIPFAILENFMYEIFVKLGVAEIDARSAAAILVESDKRGIPSHGIARMKDFYYDRICNETIVVDAPFEIIKESPTTAVIDGHHGLGHPIAKRAMQMAIDKAKQYGMGMTVVRNSNHYGIAGYYAMMAAEQGMIGMSSTNARPSVAPLFGVENMFGTNPFSFGLPTDDPFPFVFDAATSMVQRGKVEVYARAGKKMPPGWVIDQDGNPMQDPQEVLKAIIEGKSALTTLGGISEETGGHKGYGLAVVSELLCSALQQGAFLKGLSGFTADKKPTFCPIGHFFMAINIEACVELSAFKKQTTAVLRQLRDSKKAKGQDRIYTPGEKEYLYYEKNKNTGAVLSETTINEMKQIQEDLKLTGYTF